MRRYRREPNPSSMFRGAELLRLLTGVVMLGVLAMAVHRAADPTMWTWFAPDNRSGARSDASKAASQGQTTGGIPSIDGKSSDTKSGQAASEAKTAAEEQKTPTVWDPDAGPTDQDPDEAREAAMEFQVVADGSLSLQREEMVPYDRLIRWVQTQPFDVLWSRARTDVAFTELFLWPEKYRGRLVALDFDVRQVVDAGKNDAGVQLWEVLGKTPKSQAWLYWTVVVDLPKGMPVGSGVFEKARFAGYFFKLQGYHAGGAGPKDPVLKAPLLIGRLEWTPAQPQESETPGNSSEIVWGLALAAILAIGFGLQWIYVRRRPKPSARGMTYPNALEDTTPVDTWLDRCGASGDAEENRPQDAAEGLRGGDSEEVRGSK